MRTLDARKDDFLPNVQGASIAARWRHRARFIRYKEGTRNKNSRAGSSYSCNARDPALLLSISISTSCHDP